MNPEAAQGILILLSGTAGASGSVLDETGNGPCLISHSSFHIFLFPSVRDVPVFQDTSREQATWIISGKSEQSPGKQECSRETEQSQRPGDGRKKVGLLVGPE